MPIFVLDAGWVIDPNCVLQSLLKYETQGGTSQYHWIAQSPDTTALAHLNLHPVIHPLLPVAPCALPGRCPNQHLTMRFSSSRYSPAALLIYPSPCLVSCPAFGAPGSKSNGVSTWIVLVRRVKGVEPPCGMFTHIGQAALDGAPEFDSYASRN